MSGVDEVVEAKVPIDDNAEECTDDEKYVGRSKWCGCWQYDGVREARGFSLLGCGRGALIMSNIFLSMSLVYLAAEQADCLTPKDKLDKDCTNKVYGFKPASLISNIVVISGLLSAFFMPLIGAITDFTKHRRSLGIAASIVVIAIQIVQIGTTEATWFPMLLLQGLAGFFYQAIVLCAYAYLPEIARMVGSDSMIVYTSRFQRQQFASQVCFGVVVFVLAFGLGMSNVQLGHLGQAMNSVVSGSFFVWGWINIRAAPAAHKLPAGKSLATAGFSQTWKTVGSIQKHYKSSLRWFFFGITFAEAGTNVFTTLAVIFLQEILGLDGAASSGVIIFTLVSSLPGTLLGSKVTSMTNPNISLRCSLASFSIVTIIAAIALRGPGQQNIVYIFAFLWGLCLGWFYCTENLCFSLCLPKLQEAELTGFFIYCTQVLVWLPPLVYTILNEANVSIRICLGLTSVYLFVAICFLSMILPWEKAVEEATTVHCDDTEYSDDADLGNLDLQEVNKKDVSV